MTLDFLYQVLFLKGFLFTLVMMFKVKSSIYEMVRDNNKLLQPPFSIPFIPILFSYIIPGYSDLKIN